MLNEKKAEIQKHRNINIKWKAQASIYQKNKLLW